MLRGTVDLLENGKIYGWAFNTETPGEHLKITVKSGGGVISQGVADVFRMDLPKGGIGDGHHAFEIALPANVTSFRGLTVIAESTDSGSIALPIETEEDRTINRALAEHRRGYDKALRGLKGIVDESDARLKAIEEGLAELSKRVEEWETRVEANEIFLVRIDEALKSLVAEQSKRKRKRFLGLF